MNKTPLLSNMNSFCFSGRKFKKKKKFKKIKKKNSAKMRHFWTYNICFKIVNLFDIEIILKNVIESWNKIERNCTFYKEIFTIFIFLFFYFIE